MNGVYYCDEHTRTISLGLAAEQASWIPDVTCQTRGVALDDAEVE